MLRTALKPRWLGLFAVLVVVLAVFTRLGLWQLSVAQDEARRSAAAQAARQPPVPIEEVVEPHAPFPVQAAGRRITATGRYAGDGQFLVTPRRLHGRPGYWVVTPLRVEPTAATLAVVRGFTANPAEIPPVPAGTVTVTGALAPGESPAARPRPSSVALPVRGSIDLAELVNDWDGEIYNAFAFAVDERAGSAAVDVAGLTRVPPPVIGEAGVSWRNAAYALQWWIFAAFAAYMWFRMVRDDHDQQQPRQHPREEPQHV